MAETGTEKITLLILGCLKEAANTGLMVPTNEGMYPLFPEHIFRLLK